MIGALGIAGAVVSGPLPALRVPASASSHPTAKIDQGVLDDVVDGGETTYWALLSARADLSSAEGMTDWGARGSVVFESLTSVSDQTQSRLRSLLEEEGEDYRSFWVINAVRITSSRDVLLRVAALPEVDRIHDDVRFDVPDLFPGTAEPQIGPVEWNIARIRAPEAWRTFGTRGEEIVLANIDTGVEFNHPALIRQYRGSVGSGMVDHNYNWFDATAICPSPEPCDNNGHGTHTMGTMVGSDGELGLNQIGVAPRARWITAKGCQTSRCSLSSLLSSAQWVLAPTDLNGKNPRPDLRPHAVNNSWGVRGGDGFYRGAVDAWIASGIFPTFANGNDGPTCGTTLSPGGYLNTYSVGAFDINNLIASFSSRGPSPFGPGETKPNIAAPGVNVRSSYPSGAYVSGSGTSMASPHVAGTVALMWSAAPSLRGNIAATRNLLDAGAIDVRDVTCFGSTADNNVWGEGRLDAFAAVERSGDPRNTRPVGQ